jgi:acyl carrier protein
VQGAPTDQDALRRRVLGTIREHLASCDVDPFLVVDDARYGVDLAVDSLHLQTLAQELEDTYEVPIDQERAATLLTVGETIDYVVGASTPDERQA